MITLPYNIRRGMLAKSSMLSRNNTTMTFSVTLVEILKGYSQRQTSYYSEKKSYLYQMKKIQTYWQNDSTSSSHQRLQKDYGRPSPYSYTSN